MSGWHSAVGAPQAGGAMGIYIQVYTQVWAGSRILPHLSFAELYICFVSYSSPTIAAFITVYIGMGTYPGRWLGRSVGSAAFTALIHAVR